MNGFAVSRFAARDFFMY